jgi:hypothetical protein
MYASPNLLQVLNDSDEALRIESWHALAVLGSDKDLAAMISSWLNAKNKPEIEAAEDAVVKICLKPTTTEKPTSVIIAAIDNEKRMEINLSLINALGRIGDGQALPKLRELINDQESEIQLAAIRSLSVWPTADPLEDLRQISATSEEEKQKVLALRGYIQLIGQEKNQNLQDKVALYNDAMQLAWRPEEQKLVLAGYAQIHHFASLQAVEPYLSDETLQNEAAAAAIEIVDEIIDDLSDKQKCKKIAKMMETIGQVSQRQSIQEQALNIKKRIEE